MTARATLCREALRAAVSQLLEDSSKADPTAPNISRLEREAQILLEARKRAYADIRAATDPERREDAEAYCAATKEKLASIQGQLKSARRRCSLTSIDVEGETEAAMALLSSHHERLEDIQPGALRDLFSSLGVTVTVRFEEGRVGQRRVIPVSAELRLGQAGSLVLPASALPEVDDKKAIARPHTSMMFVVQLLHLQKNRRGAWVFVDGLSVDQDMQPKEAARPWAKAVLCG